ncbi:MULTISPECIES: hypothetical protein [unclassified Microcoleus]|uniref:hypothetical protein n=1 Tax=unclassified Microcoleus TaxID=2642155 RepID=UPI002FCFF43B
MFETSKNSVAFGARSFPWNQPVKYGALMMLDMKLIQSCLDQLDIACIQYEKRKIKCYQENCEPYEDDRDWPPITANVIIWLDGQKPGSPGRYADFTASNYYIMHWQLYLLNEEGIRELRDSTDYDIEEIHGSDWENRYDD